MATVLTGSNIQRFQELALLSALRLEVLGMTRKGRSAYSIAKERYNLKGNKQSVCNQLAAILAG